MCHYEPTIGHFSNGPIIVSTTIAWSAQSSDPGIDVSLEISGIYWIREFLRLVSVKNEFYFRRLKIRNSKVPDG